MSKAIYVIDASSLIDLGQRYWPSVFPGLWSQLDEYMQSGSMVVPYMVAIEVFKGDDNLSQWLNARQNAIADICEVQEALMEEIMAKYDFLVKKTDSYTVADPFVVAYARMRHDGSNLNDEAIAVITSESPLPHKKRIPFVCSEYKLDSVSLRQFFEREGMSF